MPVKTFVTPASPAEAVRAMHDHPGRGAYLAGGTDLLCQRPLPDFLINVRPLLCGLSVDGGDVVLGASATLGAIEDWPELAGRDGGLLGACLANFGSRHVRNMATVGGNLAHAVPSADLALPLLALEASCQIQGAKGVREVPLESFFTGPRQTVLGKDLLTAVRFPSVAAGARGAFLKVCHNPGAIAHVNVAALLTLQDGTVTTARIALGAVAPTPIRARQAEAYLEGNPAKGKRLQRAAALAAGAAQPISDQRASAAYRGHLCGVLVRRALEQCLRGDA